MQDRSYAIMPQVHCPLKFVTMDGIFTKSRYRLTLLVIFIVNKNRNALPLAWVLVNRENEDN